MKSLLIMLACGSLAACAGPSYRVVQSGADGDYLVAQTPSEIRYLPYDSGFYGPFHSYGVRPWWNDSYYSPNFYPHYFSVWYPSWPGYAPGYGRWDRYGFGARPPYHPSPIVSPPPRSGGMEPPSAGVVPDNPGSGSAVRLWPRDQRIGSHGRYRDAMRRPVGGADRNGGASILPPTGAPALQSPASAAWSQTRSVSRPSPTPRVQTGQPPSRSNRPVGGPPGKRRD